MKRLFTQTTATRTLMIARPSLIYSRAFSSTAETSKEEKVTEQKINYKRLTHYDLLEVKHSASEKELKIAYHRMAKKYHPDIYDGINKDHFKRVNEAYAVLKNPQKRAAYDNRSKIRAR